MTELKNDRFLRALMRQPVDVTPVWMMLRFIAGIGAKHSAPRVCDMGRKSAQPLAPRAKPAARGPKPFSEPLTTHRRLRGNLASRTRTVDRPGFRARGWV